MAVTETEFVYCDFSPDMGSGLRSFTERVKVIKREKVKPLFEGDESENLLVERSSGERVWVCEWRGVPDE